MYLPRLASVPNISREPLTIKATTSGITVLKQHSYHSRYTGNKHSAVDINGNLWLKKSDLKKAIMIDSGGKVKAKKKSSTTTALQLNTELNSQQISENLFTQQNNISTIVPKLSTFTVNKREVRQRILAYINTMKGKKELYFWTVSFPEGISDIQALVALNIWFTTLRGSRLYNNMLKEYLWVAERQKNGTIHFHIAIPHKMPVSRANAAMRGILKNLIRKGRINYSIHKIARYNGVDIAKNRNTKRVTNFAVKKGVRALVTYLTKYVTKNNESFAHLAWHNSRGFSSLFTGVTFSIPEFVSYGFHLLLNRGKSLSGEYFTFVPWASDPPDLITEHLYKLNSFLQLN